MRRLAFAALALAALVSSGAAAAGRSITVAIENQDIPPFEFHAPDGALLGFHIELIRAAATALGWSVEFVAVPWARAQAMLRDGTADAVTYIVETPERDPIAVFLPDNRLHLVRRSLLILRRDEGRIRYEPPLATLGDRWRLGAAQGYVYPGELGEALRTGRLVDRSARNETMLLRMLVAGHLDIAVTDDSAPRWTEPMVPDIEAQIMRLPGAPVFAEPVYIAFTRQRDGAAEAESFAAALHSFRETDAYRALVEKFDVAGVL